MNFNTDVVLIWLVWLLTILVLTVDDGREGSDKRPVQGNQCPSSCVTPKCSDTGGTP